MRRENSRMHAEIVSIGDELTSGQRLDTNSQWLSDQLGELGVRVLFHTTVADDLEADRQAIRLACERADIVIMTGGLGPTADDLTRAAVAAATNRELELDQQSLEHIRRLFRRRKRSMPDRNIGQAMFPVGSRPIPNPHGTAPGIEMRVERHERNERTASWLFALPGVPAEMREMWSATVRPKICELLGAGQQTIRHHRLKCFGVGESDLERMLPDLIQRGREPSVGITVSRATITLRVTARCASDEACRLAMQPTIDTIRECLGNLIFGEGDDELEHAVLRELAGRGRTLATAEWVSGGLLTHWLSGVDNPLQAAYRGGLVFRNAHAMRAMARMPDAADLPDAAESERWADSLEAAEWSAGHCRELFGADYGLALGRLPASATATGGPSHDAAKAPLAIATPSELISGWAPHSGHPDIRQARCAKHALDVLRTTLSRESG